jgi:hypothetical protein
MGVRSCLRPVVSECDSLIPRPIPGTFELWLESLKSRHDSLAGAVNSANSKSTVPLSPFTPSPYHFFVSFRPFR